MASSEANSGGSGYGMSKDEGEFKGEAIVATSEGAGSCPVEETSPDSLKNTPTNIARLEDVIEQCKGRQKYHAQTRSPSDGEDIRWYFCKVPLSENELAASVPRVEIVGKSEYFRFSMRDSLAIEASFLQREEELLSVWWKEYAECSEGPSGSHMNSGSGSTSDLQPNSSSSEPDKSTQLYEEERVGVPVKGGLYEVDLTKRHCFPVYWHGENRRVLRGHWFARKNGLDWLPLREDIAEQLEFAYRSQVWHRRTFQPSGLFAARIDLQGTTQGLHALFTGEDDTWEAWLGVETSGFSHVIGLRGNGIKLRRGFSTSGSPKPTQDELRQRKEEEMDDYCSQVPVHHLVFMVHGIGQRLEKANLVDDVGDFRHLTARLAERHLTSYQRNTQRVLFIPCQWRRGLKLGGESAVEDITLDGVRGLRVMLSATVHDVLYYMSPIYCQDIMNSVSNQLNKLYMKFIKRNPGYDGKVSIYAHSLGSVLSYDILCHQESLSSLFPMQSMSANMKNEESVNAGNQYAQSDDKNAQGNGGTSHVLVDGEEGGNSNPQLNNVVCEENTRDHSFTVDSSHSSNMEGNSSKILSNPSQEESHEYFLHTADSKEANEASLVEEDAQNLAGGSSNMFFQDGKSPDEYTDVRSQIPSGDGNMLAEDISDKDKLINLLREEVNALKAKIVELEPRDTSLILSGTCQDRGEEFHRGDRVEESAPRQCLPEKPSPGTDDSRKSYTPHIKYTKLKFKADTFFAVGSPLGVFLALRNIRIGIGKGQEYWQDERISEEMPACRQMFNIFHPFDPVAYRPTAHPMIGQPDILMTAVACTRKGGLSYRVEPLVCKEYISKRPVIIPYHRGGKRLHIGFQEFTEDLATRSQAVVSRLNSMRVKMVNVFQPRNKELVEAKEEAVVVERTYGSMMMERLTGREDGRIDHVLQDKTFEHAYISAIGAHTNYWRDPDTALFILKHLYRDIPEEPDMLEQPGSPGSLRNQRKPTGAVYGNDDMDEDLPLTFSDKSLIREFSRKAKKVMRHD